MGGVPAHQPRLVLLSNTSSLRVSFTQDPCSLSNQGAFGACGWGDELPRREHPYLIWSLWERLLPVLNGPWRLCHRVCCTVICTGRGSEGRIQGDPGDLEMVSVLGECGDRTRCYRPRCGGTRPPSCQLWKLRTLVPSHRNCRGSASCRDPQLQFSQLVQ